MARRSKLHISPQLRCRPLPLAYGLAMAFGKPAFGVGLVALLGSLGLPAMAGPQGGQVVAGQATVQQTGTLTTVTQASQRAIIDWRSFNVAAQETVRFQQPNSQSATLNRVLGNDPSAIFGRVEANGQIFLVNPNGIVFGRSARVDVGALVASTANIANGDFMAGRLSFTQPGKAGAQVINEGSITVAEGGLAALIGPSVSNHGVINARLGKVALAAGDAFTLDLRGDQLIHLVVPREALDTLTDAAGRPLAALLDHSGRIVADGGNVQLTASTASRLVDSLIKVSGDIRATSVEATPGRISLRGDQGTRLSLAGTLDVSGDRGGRIEVTARDVDLASTASLNASGQLGGGSVSVGGDWQGRGALPNAQRVDVAAGAVIDASARRTGDGGTVVVWADGDTRFAGQVASRGGAEGGHGGQVEVSGKQRLAFDGDVDASAARGRAGMLLLDPTNLVIDGAAGATSLPGTGTGDFTLRAATINRQLQLGTSVTLQADNDITVNANAQIDARGGAGAAGAGLKLDAGRNVALNGYVILNDGRFEVDARTGTFTQAADVSVATGAGAVDIRSAGALRATNLLTTGDVRLSSSAATVQVTEALGAVSGVGVSRLASLAVSGTAVTLGKDALVQGALSLTATAGGLTTATLDSRTAVTLQARDAVATGALLTPGAVVVTSSAGAVSLGAVASEATDAGNFASRKAASLTVRAAGAVSLAGAALGAGGLRVEGAGGAGTRAGAASFSAAGVFSAGNVLIDSAGDIGFAGNAGIDGGAAVTLNSGAGITTGAGALKAATTARLSAAGAMTVGTGGVLAQGTGPDALLLQAGGVATLNGRLESGGIVRVATTGGTSHVLANADVVASGVTVVSAGRFDQLVPGKVIDARSGALNITSAGALSATNLFTTGAVTLTSTGASVKVSEALGRTASRVGSVVAKAATDLELSKGALVAGATSLTAGDGTATVGKLTLGATLDSTGAVKLDADNGIDTQALMSAGSIDVTGSKSGVGALKLGAVSGSISGANQALSGTSPKAGAVTVRSAGDVAMTGGVAAASLLLAGADTAATSRVGGSVTLSGGSVYTAGDAGLRSTGMLTLVDQTGVDAGGRLGLDSSANVVTAAGGLRSSAQTELAAGGALTVGSGGVQAQAAGADALVLRAGGVATLGGPLASAGAFSLTTTGAGANVLADADVVARGVTVVAGGRFEQAAARVIDAGAGNLSVTSAGALSASNLLTAGELALTSTGASVKVSEALGRTAAPLARLAVLAANDLELAKGALVAGTATVLTAGTGGVSGTLSLGGTLDSRGSIALSSLGALGTADLLTPGDLTVSSTAGPVTMGAIAARATTADNFASEKAGAVLVRSGGSVQFNAGAAVASLQVAGEGNANRAGGSVGFANAGVYSTGDVAVSATGAISFSGEAGIDTAAALVLDSSAALTTAAGGLKAATKATLNAGGALTVGSGGVQAGATGADALLLTAAGVATLDGKLQSSSGATSITTTGTGSNVNANAGIDALGLTVTSAGTFTQTGAGLVLDARSGALNITSAGALNATNLFTTGAVTLTSTGASVKVSEALGRTASRIGSLTVMAATDVELSQGGLVSGGSTLKAGEGTASAGKLTLSKTLDSAGAIQLLADNGIATQALMSGSSIDVTGTLTGAGSVTLGAVSGSISGTAQELTDSSAKAGAVTVRSAGDVTLGGGVAAANLLVANLGTSTTSKAGGSLTMSGGSVFATGDVALRSTGALAFVGTAGIDAGGLLTLDSSAALTTAAGGLKAGTKATLNAVGTLTVGSGGVQAGATGADALVLTAAGVTTLDGKLQSSSGATSITTTGAGSNVNANAGIDALGLAINSAGTFTQTGAGLVLDARSGALSITSAGALNATNLFTTGAVTLTSTGSSLKLSEALGRTASRVGSVVAKAATDLELSKGALVAGTTTLTAGDGTATEGKLTLGATLDSTGALKLDADNGIEAQALMSGSTIDVTGTKTGVGSVTLGAVSGSISGTTQDLTDTSARAGAVTVRSAGNVTLGGGVAAASLLVANVGTSTTSNAGGSLTMSGGSVFATGDVALRSTGALAFTGTAGIDAGRDVVLDSSSTVATARGPIKAGRNVEFTGNALTLGPTDGAGSFVPDPANPTAACVTGCPSGGVTGVSNVTLTATGGDIAAYVKLQTSGGTINVTATGKVELNHVSTWQSSAGEMNSGALVVSGQDVVLTQGLGGESTGYMFLADGYQRAIRPAVGRVSIGAVNGVELNGLNLDGNDSAATTTTEGLLVQAGKFIVSNELIAVNKGAIVIGLSGSGSRADTDGVYLGNSVYSRGYDANGTVAGKTAYPITIGETGLLSTRGTLFLFDNTREFGVLSNFSYIYQEDPDTFNIPKVVIANNVANYKKYELVNGLTQLVNDQTLVGALAPVVIGASKLRSLSDLVVPTNSSLRLAAMPAATAIITGQVAALKVQVGLSAGDSATLPTEVRASQVGDYSPLELGITDFSANDYVYQRVYSVTYPGGNPVVVGTIDRTQYPENREYYYRDGVQISGPSNCNPYTGCDPNTLQYLFNVNDLNRVYGYRLDAQGKGAIAMVNETFATTALPVGSVTSRVTQYSPWYNDAGGTWHLGRDFNAPPGSTFIDNASGQVGYQLFGRVVQISDSDPKLRSARVLYYSASPDPAYNISISTDKFQASFNTNGQVQGSNGASPGQYQMTSTGNANQGFAAQGGFGGLGAGTTAGAAGSTTTATGGVVAGGAGSTAGAQGNSSAGTGVVGPLGAGLINGATGSTASNTGVVFAAGTATVTGGSGNGTGATGVVVAGGSGITTGATGNAASASDLLGSIAGGAVSGGAGNAAVLPAVRVEVPTPEPVIPPIVQPTTPPTTPTTPTTPPTTTPTAPPTSEPTTPPTTPTTPTAPTTPPTTTPTAPPTSEPTTPPTTPTTPNEPTAGPTTGPTAAPTTATGIVDGTVIVGSSGATLADVLLGRRPAADADLGRSGAGGGSSPNVFQRRYRLGTSGNAAVCAPADLESQSGGDARQCTPAK